MFRIFRQIYSVIPYSHRPRALRVLAIMVLTSLVQVLGIVSVMPFLLVLAEPDLISDTAALSKIYEMFGFSSPQQFQIVLGAATFGMLVLSSALRSLAFYAQTKFVQDQRVRLGTKLMAGFLAQPYPFFVKHPTANLAKLLTQETAQFIDRGMVSAASVVSNTLQLIALVGMLLAVDPVVTLIMAVVLGGTYTLVYRLTRPKLLHSGNIRHEAELTRIQAVWEILSGIKPIKLGGQEDIFLHRFNEPSQIVGDSLVRVAIMQTLPRYVIEAIAFGGIVLLALVLTLRGSGADNASGVEVLPLLAIFAFAGYRMMPSLQVVYAGLANIRYVSTTIETVTEWIEMLERDGIDQSHQDPMPIHKGLVLEKIRFHHVTDEARGVQDISVELPVGTSLGVVGASGAGKTTLIDLILGLLTPESGKLVVDGNPVDATRLRAWQRSLGYVPQEIFLTNRSVSENIAFGTEPGDIDQARVETCARIAQIHDVVVDELPQGYATLLGDKGLRLSGGQRQRIGIARALYQDPPVLIFDEATNALDAITEAGVLDAIEQQCADKTRIVIAHRLSSIVACDQIAVLDQGRLVDIGSYDDLWSRCAVFQDLVRADAQNQSFHKGHM